MAKKNISTKPTPVSTPKETKQFLPNKSSSTVIYGIFAVVITFIFFANALNNDFVNWDDDRNFYNNDLIKNITPDNFWESTKAIFSSNVIGGYNPLTIWTFGIEKIVYGFDKPFYWHFNNVILHLIAVFLVFRIALSLGLRVWSAFLVAVLFGIHPMRVESVTWVTERKDVLFGVFFLAALLQYILYKSDGKSYRWVLMTLFFIISLFSKIQAVTLPVTMLAVDYYLDKQWSFKTIINKIPFLLLSLAFGLFGIYMLTDVGTLSTVKDTTNFSFVQRLFVGAFSFVIYLIKVVVPFRMSALYPYPNHFLWYFYPSMLIVPIVLYVLYKSYVNNVKYVFFGLSFFVINVVLLLQVVGAGQGYLADRFTYMGYFGLFFMGAAYFEKLSEQKYHLRTTLWTVAIAYIFALGVLTFMQNKVWKNSETLWTNVLKYYTKTTLPYGNRAFYYRETNQPRKALADYNSLLALREEADALINRAMLYFTMGKGRDTLMLALNDYNRAVLLKSDDGEVFINRGATFARLGDKEKALEDLNKGLAMKPDHAPGYINRSVLYSELGRYEEALKDIETYLKLDPSKADMWYEKGRMNFMLKRVDEAIEAYSQAIMFDSPNKGLYLYTRARTYSLINKLPEAKADLQKAIDFGYGGVEPGFREYLGL